MSEQSHLFPYTDPDSPEQQNARQREERYFVMYKMKKDDQ